MSIFFLLLKSLGFLLIFILMILGLLILSPISLQASAHQNVYRFKGHYLFGIIRCSYDKGLFCVRIFGFKIRNSSTQKDPHVEAVAGKQKMTEKKKRRWRMPNREVIFYSLSALKKILEIIKPKTFEANIHFGLVDPYDTGMIALLINALPINIRMVPCYEGVDLDINGQIEMSFSIGQILGVLLLWVIKKPVRHYVFSKA